MLSDGAATMIVVHDKTAVKATQSGLRRPYAGVAGPRRPCTSNPTATETNKCSG